MKFRLTISSAIRSSALLLLVFGINSTSIASGSLFSSSKEMPKRKAGLWEINMRMQNAPGMGPMQQCIDQNTDNLMQQSAKKHNQDCSVMEIKPSGNRVTVHSVCKIEGSVATTDGVFEGSFDSSYKGTMKTRYSPPIYGMSESNMTHEARWLGPCKPGQKPGDMIMPNMGGMNINEMMKRQQR